MVHFVLLGTHNHCCGFISGRKQVGGVKVFAWQHFSPARHTTRLRYGHGYQTITVIGLILGRGVG